ncbi:MAG: hypothetical protein ACLTX6_07875 [Lachnospiraceae bacterium]
MNDYEATAASRWLYRYAFHEWHMRTENETWKQMAMCGSEKLYQFCDTMAASEYRSADPSISGYLYTFSKIEGGRMHFHRSSVSYELMAVGTGCFLL